MQAKLLLVLESQKLQRLGSNRSLHIDMRVVAATNVPLQELRDSGLMRTDFYYRVNVVLVPLLPLRRRIEDIPLLVQDFLRHHPIAKRKNITKVATRAMDQLMAYNWPGNVRELQNVLEKALVLCRTRVIENVELAETCSDAEAAPQMKSTEIPIDEEPPLDQWVKEQEKAYLVRRLRAFRGKIAPTANSCGVDVRTIRRKMRLYGLDKKDFSRDAGSGYWKVTKTSSTTAANRLVRD